MDTQPLVYDLDLPTLTDLLGQWGEPVYRAKQIWQGLYQHYYNASEEFTSLPKALRDKLSADLVFTALSPVSQLASSDKQTIKTLFRLHDGLVIEAVLMRYGTYHPVAKRSGRNTQHATHNIRARNTLCISSQAGCAMGCVFCATGQMGFMRNLSSGEIVAQVMHYARLLQARGERVTNIVLMGMGEPFHNYDNTMAALDRLNDADGYNFGARRFTVSTVGLVPSIRRFADEARQVNLAVSLHAVDDETRSKMMPVNKRYKIAELIEACKYYVEKTGRRITFEWALIHEVNDTPETARQLGALLKGLLCHVNAIPLNPTTGYTGKATDRLRAEKFKETLEQAGIACTIRLRRGIDIAAGCGQLAGTQRTATTTVVAASQSLKTLESN
jgi:23S rRNA (adenine2503-C2)-methyltransferase